MAATDITKLDLYSLLQIDETATKKEIISAYRKKALKCHPDKNPDNANAALEFQQLSKALEVLTDISAKAAYDKIWRAKKAAIIRNKELDSKRKKLKEDLEARENAYEQQKAKEAASYINLQAEIERLQKEGSKLLAEEQEYLKEQMKQEKMNEEESKHEINETSSELLPRLKIKWKSKKGDISNGGYTADILEELFSKYGEVTALVVSSKKNGSGIVEFKTLTMAQKALLCEHGLEDNPLTLSWIDAPPPSAVPECNNETEKMPHKTPTPLAFQADSYQADSYQPMTSDERAFESLVLRRLRQAEERKRLTEQILKEDEDEAKT
ncbi:dnaJ homolog subfamily C member 17-like [Octopus sinensis]|uniref:DnaJ homolog subfamily C member 17-like n=1 Tax=Octopus sinensis TaxID=2607531 RepID=A0A6P7SY05_9MOLL|nr:dnaJ homolog subfamily C member 17-like [Octopus sinensis]